MLARSNVVLDGYWENPDESARCLADGWFHTGDGGSIDDEGYLTIADRKKDVIITGGENVSSIEVEDALFSHPAVAEVAVIGVPDERMGEVAAAFVVAASGTSPDPGEIMAWAREHMANYKVPRYVRFFDALPVNASNKVAKIELRAQVRVPA